MDKRESDALCEKAGLNPNTIKNVIIIADFFTLKNKIKIINSKVKRGIIFRVKSFIFITYI